MTASSLAFISRLAELDVRIWLDQGKLRCDAPKEVLTPELVASLRERKEELVAFLGTTVEVPPKPSLFEPQNDDFIVDPYPAYDILRANQPVYRSPLGHWVLTGYQDVRAALLNPLLANTPAAYSWLHGRNSATSLAARTANNILPFMDGAPHAQARRIIASTFSAHLRTAMPDLTGIARELLAPFLSRGKLDLVNDFGRPYATLAICALLGLPREDHQRIAVWGDSFLYLLTGVPNEEVRAEVEASLAGFRDEVHRVVAQRRSRPEGDLLSALLGAGDESGRLTDDQVIDAAMLLVADGIENVASLIGSSAAILLGRAGALVAVRDDPEHARRVANECLRLETPGQFIARVALEDLTIGGQAIRKNESVLLVLGAANRDPQAYLDPHHFDDSREAVRHLSFGRGRHTCLGAQLVPQELEAALAALVELDGLRLGCVADKWRTRPGHRWLQSCAVEFNPRQADTAA